MAANFKDIAPIIEKLASECQKKYDEIASAFTRFNDHKVDLKNKIKEMELRGYKSF